MAAVGGLVVVGAAVVVALAPADQAVVGEAEAVAARPAPVHVPAVVVAVAAPAAGLQRHAAARPSAVALKR